MDTTIKATLITAVAALIGHYFQKYLERRTDLQNELRAKRVLIYTDLLQATQDALAKTKGGEHVLRDASLTTRLIAWATPEVILAFTDVWQKLEGTNASHEELEGAVANLLAAIRKDFGHDDKQAGARFDVLIARIYVPKTAAQQIVGPERG
jgi:hypothetical protein